MAVNINPGDIMRLDEDEIFIEDLVGGAVAALYSYVLFMLALCF